MKRGAPVATGTPYIIGPDEYVQTGNRVVRRCRHQQAEPVVLCTGEMVACICTRCFEQLPAGYIDTQREWAEIAAYCDHDDEIDVQAFADPHPVFMCLRCGQRRK